ncbi:GNAT family N-acetyltransferase [uncultured Arthrobacter sp.]|uniref:GNAT family N-acetyltransferase n=1 Tax=uncultured Arthrobacter sp. TaxID=114050 RepID=UPI0026356851|nr:GNAT family N-acetyltransferase [uncultured Arthrobacter sp.]
MTTIAGCQRLQRAWFAAMAQATGGRTFSTHESDWIWLPARRELMLMFPTTLSAAGLRPGLAEGVRLGARTVGVWLNGAVRGQELSSFGFEPGWQPWWMSAPVEALTGLSRAGAAITSRVPEYSGPLAAELAVARIDPPKAWHALLRVDEVPVGAAYAFYDDAATDAKALGGIFNMEVLPQFRRRGFGTALLSAVAQEAAAAGAQELALNATPEGYELYSRRGFELIGRGQTWWLQLG